MRAACGLDGLYKKSSRHSVALSVHSLKKNIQKTAPIIVSNIKLSLKLLITMIKRCVWRLALPAYPQHPIIKFRLIEQTELQRLHGCNLERSTLNVVFRNRPKNHSIHTVEREAVTALCDAIIIIISAINGGPTKPTQSPSPIMPVCRAVAQSSAHFTAAAASSTAATTTRNRPSQTLARCEFNYVQLSSGWSRPMAPRHQQQHQQQQSTITM